MNNGKQGEQLLKVLGGHSASHLKVIFFSTVSFELYFSLAYVAKHRVTEEAEVAETAVWPIPFLIYIFNALK